MAFLQWKKFFLRVHEIHSDTKEEKVILFSDISWWYRNIWERVVTGIIPFLMAI